MVASIATALAGLALPYLPALAELFELVPLSPALLLAVVTVTAAYTLVSEWTKHWFFRRWGGARSR